MEEIERFIEIQGELIKRATIGIWLGRLLVFYLLIAGAWCLRETYLSYKIQKNNEQKLEEIRTRKADNEYKFNLADGINNEMAICEICKKPIDSNESNICAECWYKYDTKQINW
jgi:hypothetical protein